MIILDWQKKEMLGRILNTITLAKIAQVSSLVNPTGRYK